MLAFGLICFSLEVLRFAHLLSTDLIRSNQTLVSGQICSFWDCLFVLVAWHLGHFGWQVWLE